MAPVSLSGLNSISDRTLFTRYAPIVKKPLPILTGADLLIISPNSVKITSGNFTSNDIGKTVSIAGSYNSRNDGTFSISKVINSITLEFSDSNFELLNYQLTIEEIVGLSNSIKQAFNKHITHLDTRIPSPYTTHVNQDSINTVSSIASDLPTAILLLNEIKQLYTNHILNVNGDFHTNIDNWNVILSFDANSIQSCLTLANELRSKFESHRIERRSHYIGDNDSRVFYSSIKPVIEIGQGSFVGPFNWTLSDPRYGVVANSPEDVVVRINGSRVDVDAVFGMIGAIILPNKPITTDSVVIDYDHIEDPPSRFTRLNSPEFVLNQDKNNGLMGLSNHRHMARSYLIDPGTAPDLISAVNPLRKSWKYKAFEREYSATTNDPKKLLLNSPFKSIKYPVLQTVIKEVTISYDAVVLPQVGQDPWKLEGDGSFELLNGLLTIEDNNYQTSVDSKPPFFTHPINVIADSIISVAFRACVYEYKSDGIFTGVGFGLSDGLNLILAGFIETQATNLSSSISIANDLKSKFNSHVIQPTVHGVDDFQDSINIVDAKDLESLVILLNSIKKSYSSHILKANSITSIIESHKIVDTLNEVISIDAHDLESAINLANELKSKYDLHRTSIGVHFVDDIYNKVSPTTQIGILTSSGVYELENSWESHSVNWKELKTYRIHRDPSGDASIYVSGDVTPLVFVPRNRLPSISNFDGKFDQVQQVFFGSINKEATSISAWNLIRVNINPLNSNYIEENKSVSFDGSKIPENDSTSPWITIGHGGYERVYSGLPGGLLLDSTCSANVKEISAMGASSGAFRGFIRIEPMLVPSTSCTIDFSASVDFYTFGLGVLSNGLYIDDGQLSVHFAFLYFSPSPAQITGSSSSFFINSTDSLYLSFDNNPTVLVNFSSTTSLASVVASEINAIVGMNVASDDGLNHVKISYGLGASSYITIIGGSAAQKLGLSIGKYFGSDSNPEKKISWFSEATPDESKVPWIKLGDGTATIIGSQNSPVMKATDSSISEYVAFIMSDETVVKDVISPSGDWKLDIRLTVDSFVAGGIVSTIPPFFDLHFAGVLVNVDEGYGGKNIELHFCVDSSNNQYISLVSFNSSTNSIDPIVQYAFAWNDRSVHSISIFTNKTSNQVFVYADGDLLTPIAGIQSYSLFHEATGKAPSLTFGSGSEPTSNSDLRTSLSEVLWESVFIFKDTKVSDPETANNRYVGVYKGGNPSLLSSWYLSKVDWTNFNSYRIVRDPNNHVAVYLNQSDTPSISVSYDPIRLPPYSSSFFRGITGDKPSIAWGAFDPVEISRTRWNYVNYFLGKMTITDMIVPPHQVLNQSNIMASPDHGRTSSEHSHHGFYVYSGGTPKDEFMSDENTEAYTILGERVPPVPMTQNLESRGGLIRSATSVSGISPLDFTDYNGFLGRFEDDIVNIVTYNNVQSVSSTETDIVNLTNQICSLYETHRLKHDIAANVHDVDDTTNIILSPVAIDLLTSIIRQVEFKSVFNSHVSSSVYHYPSDTESLVTVDDPTDLNSSIDFVNSSISLYNKHLSKGFFHFIPSVPPYFDETVPPPPVNYFGPVLSPDATDAASCSVLLEEIKHHFIQHSLSNKWHELVANYSITLNYSFIIPLSNHLKKLINQHLSAFKVHSYNDSVNVITALDAINVDSAIVLANAIKLKYNNHISGSNVHKIIDTNLIYGSLSKPEEQAILLANDILQVFNKHVVHTVSHVEKDGKNSLNLLPASDLQTLIGLVNSLKVSFNLHRTALNRESPVHIRNDVVNVVVSNDATDLESAITLLNEIRSAYESHRIEPGIHGSTAFIRLEAPSRVLYEGMKFWTKEYGVEQLVASFKATLGGNNPLISYSSNHSLHYYGVELPEQAVLTSINCNPSSIVGGDTLIVELDYGPPITIEFQPTDITLTDVVNRINSFIPSFASEVGFEIRLTSPTVGSGSSIIVNSGSAKIKLGFEIPVFSPWFVISENPSDVSLILLSDTENFLRYSVNGPSTTLYSNRVGYLLSTSLGFVLRVRIRINSVGSGSGEDSGIYVGMSSFATAFGFTAAIGWGTMSSVRYVKLQDMNSGNVLDRIPFNWFDGQFHTYSLTYDEVNQTLKLAIDS